MTDVSHLVRSIVTISGALGSFALYPPDWRAPDPNDAPRGLLSRATRSSRYR
jgi:hypothetical protein